MFLVYPVDFSVHGHIIVIRQRVFIVVLLVPLPPVPPERADEDQVDTVVGDNVALVQILGEILHIFTQS